MDALMKEMSSQGYTDLMYIEGRLCGIYKFMFTYGLMVGLDPIGYERRYCFEHLDDARESLANYISIGDNHPPGPWIKAKGIFKLRSIDLINPDLKE